MRVIRSIADEAILQGFRGQKLPNITQDAVPYALTCLSCFSSKLSQNRHPERSASQIDRVKQRLWRGVEGPRRCLSTHAAGSFTTTGLNTVFPGAEKHLLAIGMSGAYIYIVGSHTGALYIGATSNLYLRVAGASVVEKLPAAWVSAAEVLRLRATSAVSRDQSVRRSGRRL